MLATQSDSDLDRGPAAIGGERTCALTREVRPVGDLIRFVVGPDGNVVPDVKRKLPGRGLWIGLSRTAVDRAVKRGVFARGFRRAVKVDPGLAALTESLLERSALDALAMAGKAGGVVTGFAKVEAALAGDAVALVHASEAAEDGKRKLAAALNRRPDAGKTPVIDSFSGRQLDLALNRINVVHAALLNGPASSTFLARTERFRRFRTGFSAEAAVDHETTTPVTAPVTREQN